MTNRNLKLNIAKMAASIFLITLFIYSMMGITNGGTLSEGINPEEPIPLPNAGAEVENPILSTLDQSVITANNQIAQTLATQIIDSITSGTFYFGRWEPSLESMCEGLSVLKWLNAINTLDSDRFANFIMAQFDSAQNLFIDSTTGFLNYSYDKQKVSISPIEATAYAIISLDTLNKLDRLDISQKNLIISNMLASVNRYDGGFCHRIDGVKPKGFENSSIRLSYWLYTALDILQPGALSSDQLNNLTRFVKNQQYKGVGTYIYDGSFRDNSASEAPSVETCYFAVKLLQKLGKLNEINLVNLREHIELLFDAVKGGVFEDYFNSKFVFKNPEYYSTACALAINSAITGIVFDPSACESLIMNNFNQDLGYWRTFFGSNISLLHTGLFLVVQPFYESGRSVSSTIRTKIIAGMADYYANGFNADLGYYWNAIMPLSRRHGSITYLAEKIEFLNTVGRLSSLSGAQKDAIYLYVKNCAYVNKSNLAHSFQEFPDFTTTRELARYCANMVEFSLIPYNETSLARNGRGIHQTHAALDILSLIGKLAAFHAEKNLNNYAVEILNCQIRSGTVNSGALMQHSSQLLGSSFLYVKQFVQSVPRGIEALESLQIIDGELLTSYASQVDLARLKGFLESWKYEGPTEEYFTDITVEGREDPRYAIEITDSILTLDETLSMSIADSEDTTKILAWINTHEDNCQMNDEYEFYGAYHGINLLYMLGGDIGIPERLSHFRTIFNEYLGTVSANRHVNLLDRNQIGMLTHLNDERISEVKFQPSTGIFAQIMFQPVFEVYVAGVYTLNFQSHALECRITASDTTHSDWISFIPIDSGTKYQVTIPADMELVFYPQFTCEIKDTDGNLNLRTFSYTLNASIHHVADVQNLVNSRESFRGQYIAFKIGLYLHSTSGVINIAIKTPTITATVYDTQDAVIFTSLSNPELFETTETEEGGINWILLTMNSSQILGEYRIEIEISHELLADQSTIIDTGDIVPIEYNETQTKYVITLTGTVTELTSPKDYSMIALGSILAIGGGIFAFLELKKRRPKHLAPKDPDLDDDEDIDDEEIDLKQLKRDHRNRKMAESNTNTKINQAPLARQSSVLAARSKPKSLTQKAEEPVVVVNNPAVQQRISKLQALKTIKGINVAEQTGKVEELSASKVKEPPAKEPKGSKKIAKQNPKPESIPNPVSQDTSKEMLKEETDGEQEEERMLTQEASPKQEIISKFSPHVESMRQGCSILAENIQSKYLGTSPYFVYEQTDLDPDTELKLYEDENKVEEQGVNNWQDGHDSNERNDTTKNSIIYSATQFDNSLEDEKPIIQSKRLGISFTDKQLELYSKED